jgi:hypothetical protein
VIKIKQDEISGNVGRTGDMRNTNETLVGNLKGRDHLKGINLNGKIILILILKKLDSKSWIRLHRLILKSHGCNNKPSDPIRGGELLDHLSDFHFLKNGMEWNETSETK